MLIRNGRLTEIGLWRFCSPANRLAFILTVLVVQKAAAMIPVDAHGRQCDAIWRRGPSALIVSPAKHRAFGLTVSYAIQDAAAVVAMCANGFERVIGRQVLDKPTSCPKCGTRI